MVNGRRRPGSLERRSQAPVSARNQSSGVSGPTGEQKQTKETDSDARRRPGSLERSQARVSARNQTSPQAVKNATAQAVCNICVALVEKVINFSNFQQVFIKLDKNQSGRWSWKIFQKFVKKADKSAGLEITKVMWNMISSTADVEHNESIWNFLVSKTTEAGISLTQEEREISLQSRSREKEEVHTVHDDM